MLNNNLSYTYGYTDSKIIQDMKVSHEALKKVQAIFFTLSHSHPQMGE